MAKKVTIYDVANRANVAISTVSRVLNDSPYVSDKTKKKVKAAIEELEFYPQVNARKLASKEPQMIAMAVPTFTTPFFNEVLKGVKDEITNIDLDLIIFNTGSSDSKENFKKFLDRGTPDALIIFSIEIDDEIDRRLSHLNVPIILIDTKHPNYDYYWWDNYKGGYLAGEHLAAQGFQKIGLIRAHTRANKYVQREQGFRDALNKNNIPLQEEYVASGITRKHAGFSEEAGYEALYIMHNRDSMPDAIFCMNDMQALGALHALSELNLSVPEDVALIGYDNVKIAKYLSLTTLDQKMIEIGKQATKRLAKSIYEDLEDHEQVTVEPELIERKSTYK
ncbi:MAG TPA: LacI family DNA-binding transcriptional regulator [Balneolales bacterium]|nr:LacI family DNA-binding transcriptional regulator [Balneolales bacterium]